MGNTQTSRGALAQFYEANGADVSKALSHMAGPSYRADLCRMLSIPDGGAGVTGGAEGMSGKGESYIGGVDDLQNYGNSMYSKAKENLIREIAADVFNAMRVTGVKDPRTAPIADVVKQLTNLFPPSVRNPKKLGESFSKSSSNQKAVCNALGAAINKHYAGALIDLSGDENVQCNKIAEIMYSLLTGLQVEFMNIAGDVMRVMNNMAITQRYLDSAYTKQKELINSSADPALKDQSASTDEVYRTLKSEYERQNAILANLVNISIGPAGKSLISSLEDNRDFTGLVKDLRTMVGSQAFGDKLSVLLSGISSVAHSADLVDKALKKIGMSISEFKSAKNTSDLRSKVFHHIMGQSPNSKRLDEMMKAAKIIYEANYDHVSISKLLGELPGGSSNKTSKASRNKRGGDETQGVLNDDNMNGLNVMTPSSDSSDSDLESNGLGDVSHSNKSPAALGGADELPAYWEKKSLSKKITNKKTYRDLILKDFGKEIKVQLQTVVASADAIAKHIGTSIMASEELKTFIDMFSNMPNLDQENLYIALSGYPKDSVSKERRERFMYAYDSVMRAAEPLTKGPNGQLFRQVSNAILAMMKTIDNFSDKMVKALTDIHVDSPDEIAAAIRKTASTFYGSGDGGDDSFGAGSWVAFEKVQNELKYYYSIANVKSNLSRSYEDLKSYAEDYEQILGEEAAWLIDRIKTKSLAKIEGITDASIAAGAVGLVAGHVDVDAERTRVALAEGLAADMVLGIGAGGAGQTLISGVSKANTIWALENLKTVWTFQMNAKVNMVKVAQAIDMYMRAFTDGIAKHPDSISSVVKMLDNVEFVAKWFNDRSGDNLASMFEVFPCSMNGAIPTFNDGKDSVVKSDGSIKVMLSDGTHYYKYLEQQWTGGVHDHLPGNPFLGRPLSGSVTAPAQCKGIITLSSKVIKSMRALENILSVFVSVGSKFGDLDPMSKTFMNPGQIFNALCDYTAASAFATEFAPIVGGAGVGAGAIGPNAAVYLSKTKAAAVTHSVGAVPPQTIPTANPDRARNVQNAGAVNGLDWSENLAIARNDQLCNAAAPEPPIASVGSGILTGVANVVGGVADKWRSYQSIALSGLPAENTGACNGWRYHDAAKDEVRLDLAGWRDNFFDTDNLFVMTIKSIVAKIFTVVDAYRMFHRPTTDRRTHYSLNPLRSILGGNASGGSIKVQVIPEALELYFRLILLAEWYRERFGFKGTDANGHQYTANAWRVAIVPTVDGIWSDLIEVVFDKADYVKEGNYTESQIQRMILAMNDIWKAYRSKYPSSTTRGILNAFVLEMNRVFGFMKQQEIDAYLKDRRNFLEQDTDLGDSSNTFVDYDILSANDQFGARPAPSDKFARVSAKPSDRKARSMVFLQEAVEKLRKEIDVDFLNATQGTSGDTVHNNFQETLKNYRLDLSTAKSETAEYQVVLRMLQGANKYVHLNADKLLMVHESVAAPLTVLYAVYKVLARYNAMLHGCSLMNLAEFNAGRGAGGLAGGALDNNENTHTALLAFFNGKYPNVTPANKPLYMSSFARSLVGNQIVATPVAAGNSGYLTQPTNAGVSVATASLDAVHLLQDLLAAIIDFGTNPNRLVTVAVGSNGNVNVDFSALEEACRNLLAQVKDNAKKLRNMFAANEMSIVDKYEDMNTVGSTRWLDEHLMQILFTDRDECGLPRAANHLTNTLSVLLKPGAVAGNIGEPAARYGSLDDSINGLLHYEITAGGTLPDVHYPVSLNSFPGNTVAFKREPVTQAEKDIISGIAASIAAGPAAGAAAGAAMVPAAVPAAAAVAVANAAAPAAIELFNGMYPMPVIYYVNNNSVNNWEINTTASKSLVQSFNKTLHQYLHSCIEEGNNKIYTPLIEQFATSAASLEVIQGKAFPNIGKYSTNNSSAYNGIHSPLQGANGVLAPGTEGVVVYASNALIMRSLITTVITMGPLQKKKFAYESINDIPEYMKERMCVNLPIFSKIFGNIAERASLLKTLINNTTLKECVTANGAGAVLNRAAVGTVELAVRAAGTNNATYFNSTLSHLVECAQSIRKCADSVYKELADKPSVFLDVSKEFLNDYRSRNGGSPLMPASSVLVPLGCLEGNPNGWKSVDRSHAMLPVSENGSAPYKFNYATRLILARNEIDPSLDHFPGAKDIYNAYVASTDKNSLVTPVEYAKTIVPMVKLGRFLMDGMVYGRLFNKPSRNINMSANSYNSRNVFCAANWRDRIGASSDTADLIAAAEAAAGAAAQSLANACLSAGVLPAGTVVGAPAIAAVALPALAIKPYSSVVPIGNGDKSLSILALSDANGINGAIELTENVNVVASKERMSKALNTRAMNSVGDTSRVRMRVLNILDSGIVPLNVHAFMREVPFINLLNYSYTFDRMVHDFVLPSYIHNGLNGVPRAAGGPMIYAALPGAALTVDNLIISANTPVASTRELLVKLLVHPYANLGDDGAQYFALLASLFNGNDNMKLGRPRYLSDQLWHKVLMTSSAQLVAGQEMYNNPANRYDLGLSSLESGPAAYEAVRAVVQYGSPNLDLAVVGHPNVTNAFEAADNSILHKLLGPGGVFEADRLLPTAAFLSSVKINIPRGNTDLVQRSVTVALMNAINDPAVTGAADASAASILLIEAMTPALGLSPQSLIDLQNYGAGLMAGAGAGAPAWLVLLSAMRRTNMLRPSMNGRSAGNLVLAANPNSTAGLKVWNTNTNTWSVANPAVPSMSVGDVLYCAELGKMRFDTKLVRNLTWFVQLQRVMRVVLINHLSWLNTPVVRGLKIADSNVTEYEGNDQFDNDDFNGKKYSAL